jgi:hypothetical protein
MKSLLRALFKEPAIKYISRAGMAVVVILAASASPAVAQIYNFSFIGNNGMDATGTITISGGVAQSGSITVTGVPVEASPSTLISVSGFLLPASGPTDAENHDGDVITYDNIVNLANDPIFNGNGLGFGSGPYQDSTHYNLLVNLWGNSPGSYGLFVGEALLDSNGHVIGDAQYVYAEANSSGGSSFTVTPVPEPSTSVLIILGALTGVYLARRRRRAAA